METEAVDNQANLVYYDNENENEIDDLRYQSEEYIEDAHEDDENNHSNGYAKRGITRLCKFRREYGKPSGVKLSVTFNALNRISGKHRALFSSFLRDMRSLDLTDGRKADGKKEIEPDEEPTRGTLWLKGRVKKDGEYPDDEIRLVGGKLVRKREVMQEEWEVELHTREGMVTKLKNQLAAQGGKFQSIITQLTPPNVSPVDINPINSSADEWAEQLFLDVRMTRAFRSLRDLQLWKRKWKQG
ncbi:hypothetical protein Tco_1445138 [Tanacetum coccineum]